MVLPVNVRRDSPVPTCWLLRGRGCAYVVLARKSCQSASLVAQILVNVLSSIGAFGETNGEVSATYHTPLTPAG